MEDKTVIQELKEICNLIVGRWYSEKTGQELDFSFTDQLLKPTALQILEPNKKTLDTVYTIGIFPTIEPKLKTDFYFEIGYHSSDTKYLIKNITKDKSELIQAHYYEIMGNEINYIRRTNINVAEEILKGL